MPRPLELADLRQGDDDAACGKVALRVVWSHFGTRVRLVPCTPIDGTSPDVIESLLWHSGLPVQAGQMDADDLKYHTSRGRPVICCVTEAGGGGHWVVVGGVYRGRVHLQCPLAGPLAEPVADFVARWTDQTRRGTQFDHWGIAAG